MKINLKSSLKERHPETAIVSLPQAALVDRMRLWWCRSGNKGKLARDSMPVAAIIDVGEWSNTDSGPLTIARTTIIPTDKENVWTLHLNGRR
jgi:hypothetical protein